MRHRPQVHAINDDYTQAISKLYRIQDDERVKRQSVWRTIQTEAPDIARLLTGLKKEFGDLAAVQVVINEKTELDKGVYLPERGYDKYLRRIERDERK